MFLCHISLEWKRDLIFGVILQCYSWIVLHPQLGHVSKMILSFHFNLGRSLWREEAQAVDDSCTCEHGCTLVLIYVFPYREGRGSLFLALLLYTGCVFVGRFANGEHHQCTLSVQKLQALEEELILNIYLTINFSESTFSCLWAVCKMSFGNVLRKFKWEDIYSEQYLYQWKICTY